MKIMKNSRVKLKEKRNLKEKKQKKKPRLLKQAYTDCE
jgi:hypothetical protein